VIDKFLVAELPRLPVVSTVKLKLPAEAGALEIIPPELDQAGESRRLSTMSKV
jgi:hypothetical protein